MNLYHIISADAKRYASSFYRQPGFWISFSYRVRRYRKYECSSFILRWLFIFPDLCIGFLRWCFSPMRLPSSVPIGQGLYLPHPEGIFINDKASIGCNVSIFQQVTLGEWRGQAPLLEDGVSIYAGAKVFGGVTIGKNAQIGANAVVNIDVPDDHVYAIDRQSMVLMKKGA